MDQTVASIVVSTEAPATTATLATEATRIRTFHPRRSRISVTASDALARLWPDRGFDIAPGCRFDPMAAFGRIAPMVLEIGSGMGDATIEMARTDPERDYLAVDVHTPGLGSLLARAEADGLTNVHAALGDAMDLLRDGLDPASLDAIHVFFPDPWPKARHHKRRIIQPEPVALMCDRLRPGGTLHAATDWPDYAEQMLEVLSSAPGLVNRHDGFAPRPAARPVTKYERRGVAAGRPIHDLAFTRVTP
jgi:tRNA (guanine-N7-)-methyltransferase